MDDLKNDIDKYLKGELSPSEMHALEKKALRDPFLEDALEGSSQIPTESLEADLQILEAKLDQRIKAANGKTISIWVWPLRIAAGLLLIASSTFVIIQFTGNKSSEDLALKGDSSTVQKQLEVQPPAPADSVVKQSDSYLSLAKPEEPKSSREEYEPQESKEETANTIPLDKQAEEESAEPTPAAPAIPKTDEVQIPTEIIEEEKIAQAAPEQSRMKAFRIDDSKKTPAVDREKDNSNVAGAASRASDDVATTVKVIRGKVSAEDGLGLPGVNVMIKGSSVGTVTDALGNYQIPVSGENPNLLFSFIGYLNTEVNASGKDEVNLQMSEDVAQLSEVVVVGYGDGPLNNTPTEPLELAEPAGGRRAFKQYLEQSLRYPEEALNNNVEGKVIVMFTIETSGQLSDFRVLRGIGNGCDEEVIRLIKEGPKWTPSKRKDDAVRDKVKVRMRFTLPKNKK